MPEEQTPTVEAAVSQEAKISSFDQAAEAARKSLEGPPSESQIAPEASSVEKTPVETSDAVPDPTVEATAEDSPLLSQEAIDELSPDQLKAYRKRLQADYTRKTQKVAEDRKKIAELVKVNEAYERDPVGTLRLLAEQHGIKFAEQPTEKQIARVEKTLVEELREALGPDLDVLADRLAPVLQKVVERVDNQVKSKIEPIAQQQIAETAAKQAEAVLQQFQAKHADYPRYEAKMSELADKYLPSGKVSEMEYLEMLYQLAAGQEKAIIEALDANNRAVSKSEPLPPGAGVNPEKVSPHMPKGISFKEGFERASELARQGILVTPK